MLIWLIGNRQQQFLSLHVEKRCHTTVWNHQGGGSSTVYAKIKGEQVCSAYTIRKLFLNYEKKTIRLQLFVG